MNEGAIHMCTAVDFWDCFFFFLGGGGGIWPYTRVNKVFRSFHNYFFLKHMNFSLIAFWTTGMCYGNTSFCGHSYPFYVEG